YFTFGVDYRVSEVKLGRIYPNLDPSLVTSLSGSSRGTLHLFTLDSRFNHPSGFFGGIEAQWWAQDLGGQLASLHGDDFWQLNSLVGYRSPRRHVEVVLGVLNINGSDYRLHPISLYPELPRERTFFARLSLNF
ncbi:MAG TPA: hypothetical protein VGE41_10265, partial [Verrucomicrobiae bacterium]